MYVKAFRGTVALYSSFIVKEQESFLFKCFLEFVGNVSLAARYVLEPAVPKSATLNDLERRNGRYFALFYRIRHLWGQLRTSG